MKKQIIEKEEHNEKLECEIVSLRKEHEKAKSLNLRFAKGYETLYEIIKVQCSPLIKTGLGYCENIKDCKSFCRNKKLSQCSKEKQAICPTTKEYMTKYFLGKIGLVQSKGKQH